MRPLFKLTSLSLFVAVVVLAFGGGVRVCVRVCACYVGCVSVCVCSRVDEISEILIINIGERNAVWNHQRQQLCQNGGNICRFNCAKYYDFSHSSTANCNLLNYTRILWSNGQVMITAIIRGKILNYDSADAW